MPRTWSKYVGPNLYCDSSKLSVRVDRHDWFHWSQKEHVEVNDLDFDKAHLVEVRCEGKPLQATKFRFSDYKSTHVCVTYDVYGGIYLFDYTTRGWGCTKAAPKSRLP